MSTGQIIKGYRTHMGLSQETVSNFLDIKRELLSYYETDTREAPLKVLEKLSDLYGIELADFFEEDEALIKTNIAFAFRAEGLEPSDMEEISSFRKIIKNYFKISELEKTHGCK